MDINRLTTDQQVANRDLAEAERNRQKLQGNYTGNAFDDAAMQIKAAEASQLGKQLGFKSAAINESTMAQTKQQYIDEFGEVNGMERFNDRFTGDVQVRNLDRSLDNMSLNPFEDSWDQGWKNLSAGAYGVLNMLGEETGWEAAANIGEDGVIRKNAELADYGSTILDYKEVDGFSSAIQYLGNNLALSLPQMGATAVAVAAAPFTAGTSLSVPAAIYAGQTWNEMEGEKSAAWAIGAGVAQGTLDMLGLKIATKGLGGDQILKKAVSELMKKGATKKAAEQTVAQSSRRQIAEFTGAAAEHAKKQIAAKQLGQNLMKAVGVGGVGEGLTEVAQESIGYLAAVNGSDKQFDWNDYNNRIIAAAIAGGSLGGAISSGSTISDAGAWADVAYRLAPADAKHAAESEFNVEREKATHGRVRSVEEIAADAGNRAVQAPGLSLDDRAASHKLEQGKKSTLDRATEQALNVSQLWQGATRNIFTPELKRKSAAAVALADMFGGSLDKTHSGSSFENSKFHRVAVYKNMVPDPKSFYTAITNKGWQSAKEKNAISKDFYTQIQRSVGKDGKFDPKMVPDGPRKQAIIQMGQEMSALSDKMYADQKKHNPELGYINNYLGKYKALDKVAVEKNKTGFIQALEKSGYKRAEAHKLVDEILNNPEVADVDDAFSVTKGGIVPPGHKKRSLNMAEKAEFQDFMQQDMFANMSTAAKAAARYTAHRDYIGKNGSVISKLLDDMQAEGVPPAEVDKVAAQMKNYLDAESGNYKRPSSELGKSAQRFQKNFMMFSTLSALPLATISSLVETMLIHRGLRTDQIFGKEGSLLATGKELANTLWEGAKQTTTVGFAKEGALNDRQKILKDLGFYEWDVGAATVTGVSEVNEAHQYFYEGFFKWTGLSGFTNFTRAARAAIGLDYMNDKAETIWKQRHSGADKTREVQEAEEQLRNLGVDVDQYVEIYELKKGGLPITEQQEAFIASTVREGTFNFVNEAIVLPQSANRPLIYQDPRFALFTQFQGFIATFTANQIPKLWSEYVKRGTPAMKYNAFALATTMIAMGFVSQHLKDLIKYQGKTPHLEDPEYLQRGIRASGLLGTSERVLDQFFPLYEKNSDGKGEWAFNQIAGESAAISYGEKLAGAAGSFLSGDAEQGVYKALRAAPVIGPLTNPDKFLAQGLTGGGWKYKGE